MKKKQIEITNLSKKYRICHEVQSNQTIKESITNGVKNKFRKIFGKGHATKKVEEDFWALKEINLSVDEGDQLAILGKNGSGKSTLLKILSRVTHPTQGVLKIRGRVASLLEVGTGFHPDLSGRENIYLNGAILGMSYKEIKSKFDEIVDFAEIEHFLETPVKRFSSGMYMRLGFAIASHLNSEILIVDEVFSVGDVSFQEKCMKKIHELRNSGKTLFFVTHQLATVSRLCTKGIVLQDGIMAYSGTIEECLNYYAPEK